MSIDYTSLDPKAIDQLALSVQPGAWAVEPERPVSTLLGSCVAVCLFDPLLRVGGLNHFMLPTMRTSGNGDVDSLLSGAYAMEALLNALLQRGAKKPRLLAKAFGGGTITNTTLSASLTVGMRNAAFAREWLDREGIPLMASDFLGPWSRKVLFVPRTGDAFCRRVVTSMATAEVIAREERLYMENMDRQATRSTSLVELF